METNIEIIRKAIKAAGGSERGSLADVLLAIEDNEIYCVLASGEFGEATHEGIRRSYLYWNLRKDTLTDQSDECLTFLANLLK